MYAISIQLAEEKFKFSHIKQENERLLEICGKLDANFEGHKGKVDAFLSPSDARASKFQDFEASMIEIESSYNYKIGELDKKFNNLMDGVNGDGHAALSRYHACCCFNSNSICMFII